ncbi:MAG: hypothetical protein ACOY0S_03100 [Patescibacteria group bacterium]
MPSPETSLVSLKQQFHELLGFRATAPISEEQATQAAHLVAQLEGKLVSHATHPGDLLRAAIAASQRLQWYEQENREVATGTKSQLGNPEIVAQIQEKFSGGDLPSSEIERLSGLLYHHDPALGAQRAMDVLLKLHQAYPEIPLKGGDELELGASR